MNWQAFWAGPNAIYAGDRHLRAHYRRILDDLQPLLPPPEAAAIILDYGCGEALAAQGLAQRAGHVWLYDASPHVRTRLATRLAGAAGITVCDEAAVSSLADASVDVALLISVVQYLDPPTLTAALATLRRVLKPGGRLIIADIIEPGTPLRRDLLSRLKFAATEGFLLADLAALVRLYLSDYRRFRSTLGLTAYDAAGFAAVLAAAGFTSERLPRNIGPTAHRLAFVARRATP